jgi:flagellar assembly protein FliH
MGMIGAADAQRRIVAKPMELDRMTADVEVFDYPAVAGPEPPSWEAFSNLADFHVGADRLPSRSAGAHQDASAVEMHAKELERSFEAGLARGREEGRSMERQAFAAASKAQETLIMGEAARLAESFHAQRTRYFESVERDVVRLALAIAARILRREAQMDPLLLSGAVRVALGQLSAATQVRLRVPPADLDLWKDTITHLPNLAVKPEVVPGEQMRLGDCVLEAELGSVDLGLGSQLAEIERGFFDRSVPHPEPAEEDMSE